MKHCFVLYCIFLCILSAVPDVWSSVVAGRKPSFSDVQFPKPKHVPGTTMTLHGNTQQLPWQQGAISAMKKSTSTPGLLGQGSYQSQGQMSPGMIQWLQGQGQMATGSSQGRSHGSKSSGEPLHPSQFSRVSEHIAEEREGSRSPSSEVTKESLKNKVTFSLTDSASSKSTESGFSENPCKAETYASVCTNCQSAMAEINTKQKSLNTSHNREGHRRHHSGEGRPGNGACDECNKHDHRHKHSDSDPRNLQHRNKNFPRGRGYHHDNGYQDRGQYYHKGGNYSINQGQGQGYNNRRGFRGGYRGNRGYKRDFYHRQDIEHQRDHRSEPILPENDEDNRPMRRSVSSPDKTYGKSHIEFTYDHVESREDRNETRRTSRDERYNGIGQQRSRGGASNDHLDSSEDRNETRRSSRDERGSGIEQQRHRGSAENRSSGGADSRTRGSADNRFQGSADNVPKLSTPEIYVEAEGRSPTSGDSEETQWINVQHRASRKRQDSERSQDSGSSQSHPHHCPQRGQGHQNRGRGNLRGRGSRSMEKYEGRPEGNYRDQYYRDRAHSDREGYFRGRGRGERDWYYRGRGHSEGSGSYREWGQTYTP